MAGTRAALIVATDRYESAALTQLAAPSADARALADVLSDPTLGGFDVEVVLNATSWTIAQRVEELLSGRKPGDLVLLHFSCHGLKDDSGELYLAATNTSPALLASTAVDAALVNRLVRRSRAARIVLVLDCCYGGAFERGAVPRAGGDVDVAGQFPQAPGGGGRGRAIITASSAMEYAFEGARLSTEEGSHPSVFTGALVEGIRTGAADRDDDGFVSLGELYDYVYDRVRAATPHQTPCKWEYDMQGELHLARNPHRRVRPGKLPPDLHALLTSSTVAARLGAVAELTHLAAASDLQLAAAAQAALVDLSADDSQRVSAAAREGAARGAPSLPETQVLLGTGRVGGPPLSVGLPVGGSALALASTVLTTGSPLRAELDSGVLRLSAPTERPGPIAARVTLTGPAGETSVDVLGDVVPAQQLPPRTLPPWPLPPREVPPQEVPPRALPATEPRDGAGDVDPDVDDPPAPPDARPRWLWPAVGAAAAVLLTALTVLLWPDGDDGGGGDTAGTEVARQEVTVDGTAPFTDTGLELSVGQQVSVTADGQVTHNGADWTGPEGFPNRPDLLTPLPTENHNALIARIAPDRALFLIGSSTDFTVETSGVLQLGINDGGLENNSGSYTALVVVRAAE